jgi:hypothetical protein
MARSPTRITSSTESLIHVIITNKDNPELRASVVDLGFFSSATNSKNKYW